jgi:hypothetical protein
MIKVIYLLSLTIFGTVWGQKQGNIWFFGDSAGVNFNGVNPTALLNGQTKALEGTSVIADSSGSVLFYSDGMTVWNKYHQVMLNGTNLLGNTSTTQSSIVVPEPTNSNRYYYLFTLSSGFAGGNISDGLRYSKVDICLDSARGGIIPTEKNIKLVDTVAEKIAVTRHSNGTDYWILTHKFYSNEFWALHLSSNGFLDTVVSAIGSFHTGNIAGSQGQLKFSSNGQKIAIAASNGLDLLEVFDFDKTTGIVSNFQPLIIINNGSVYGVEFSHDGSKLYTVSSSFTPFSMDVSQYDLTAGNLATINSSLNSIYNETTIVTGRGLQIGTNGKIYMVSLSNPFALAAINNPNIYGVGCNFQDQSISLSGKKGNYTLPSFIAGFDYSNELVQCDQVSIFENSINKDWIIYPNPTSQTATLEFINSKYRNCTLTLCDSYGRLVRTITDITTDRVEIERQNLMSGLYFLKLHSEGQIILSSKLIIE